MGAASPKCLTSVRRLPTLRTVVAWVSVVAFLVVGFAHSFHDFSSSPSTPPSSHSHTVLQTSTADSAKHSTAMSVHCDACEIVMMTVRNYAPADAALDFEVPVPHFASFQPHLLTAETPPPIATL